MTDHIVTLAGTPYKVPEFTIAQLETVLAFVMRWASASQDRGNLTPMKVQDLTRAVYHGAVQPNCQMTWDDFRKLQIPGYELVEAFKVIQDQTHLFKPAQGAATPTGEAPSQPGTESSQN